MQLNIQAQQTLIIVQFPSLVSPEQAEEALRNALRSKQQDVDIWLALVQLLAFNVSD